MRNLCKKCGEKPVAINYRKENRTYYRSSCDSCARGVKNPLRHWRHSGYKLKDHCEMCGYHSKHTEQFDVYFIDGDLTNFRYNNLKTICANCQRLVQKQGVKWRRGDLTPDH